MAPAHITQNSNSAEVSEFILNAQNATEIFSRAFESLTKDPSKNYKNQESSILAQARSNVTANSSLGELLGISKARPPQDDVDDINEMKLKLKLLYDVWLAIRQQLVKESYVIQNEDRKELYHFMSPNFGLIVPVELADKYHHPYDLTPTNLLKMQFSTETD